MTRDGHHIELEGRPRNLSDVAPEEDRRYVLLGPKGNVLAATVRWARTPRKRARGLLGAPELAVGQCLWLEGSRRLLAGDAVHTFGIRYPIDVLFCDRRGCILHVVRSLPPGRVSPFVRGARHVVEFPAGTLEGDVVPGHRVALLPAE
jgi:uncharacterized protein